MTQTKNVTASAVSPDVATGVAQFLAPVVVDLTALAIDAKQAHWHVRGANFQAIHELLDTVVAHARDAADLAAERIIALGLPLDARTATVAERTTTPTFPEGFISTDAAVAHIIAAIDATLVQVRTAVAELDDIDLTSQDLVIGIQHQLEQDRWFLFAHIAK
ncbi:MAG TPA: DNA starvation/stationary phase protection protein [Microbacteriaceae bacterium]|nr:DNA starvation/stationary phase protection protein [Microbacteriaceae bacterium]